MNVRLRTNFLDYYDHWFDMTGIDFYRKNITELTRSEMLDMLKNKGFNTPVNGICSTLKYYFLPTSLVVVYLNQLSHCGEDKKLMPYQKALELHSDKLISEYLKGDVDGLSFRYLAIGDRSWLLKYQSDTWQSNVGNVDISIIQEYYAQPDVVFNFPLYAIDFIKDFDTFYAIDLNTSPGLKYTRMEKLLEPKEVVRLIKDKISRVF